MTLTLRFLGLELLHLSVATDSTDTPAESGPGDCTATALGFGFNGWTRWDADGVE